VLFNFIEEINISGPLHAITLVLSPPSDILQKKRNLEEWLEK